MSYFVNLIWQVPFQERWYTVNSTGDFTVSLRLLLFVFISES